MLHRNPCVRLVPLHHEQLHAPHGAVAHGQRAVGARLRAVWGGKTGGQTGFGASGCGGEQPQQARPVRWLAGQPVLDPTSMDCTSAQQPTRGSPPTVCSSSASGAARGARMCRKRAPLPPPSGCCRSRSEKSSRYLGSKTGRGRGDGGAVGAVGRLRAAAFVYSAQVSLTLQHALHGRVQHRGQREDGEREEGGLAGDECLLLPPLCRRTKNEAAARARRRSLAPRARWRCSQARACWPGGHRSCCLSGAGHGGRAPGRQQQR